MKRLICLLLVPMFLCFGGSWAQAQVLSLPKPGTMVYLSQKFTPQTLTGIKVYADNPFRFDFVLAPGETAADDALEEESTKLIKYFLAALTVPEKDQWVNLSPYEKDRIVPDKFGQTEMGRDLLSQDYLLKQVTASLIYPEDDIGRKFWKRIYEETAKKLGNANVPVNTFNKVWIVPDKAVIYENAKAGTAYVVESRLKVMLDEDYLASRKNKSPVPGTESLASQIVREVVIPQLTMEVNEGKNFSQLRQIYSSLILATWYKKKIRASILSKVYADKNKVDGVNTADPDENQKIYDQYVQAFKKGVYNYIKEETDPASRQIIPRKYFSGGVSLIVPLEIKEGITATPAMIAEVGRKIIQMFIRPEDPTQQQGPLTWAPRFGGDRDEQKQFRTVLGLLAAPGAATPPGTKSAEERRVEAAIRSESGGLNRRGFLKRAATGALVVTALPVVAGKALAQVKEPVAKPTVTKKPQAFILGGRHHFDLIWPFVENTAAFLKKQDDRQKNSNDTLQYKSELFLLLATNRQELLHKRNAIKELKTQVQSLKNLKYIGVEYSDKELGIAMSMAKELQGALPGFLRSIGFDDKSSRDNIIDDLMLLFFGPVVYLKVMTKDLPERIVIKALEKEETKVETERLQNDFDEFLDKMPANRQARMRLEFFLVFNPNPDMIPEKREERIKEIIDLYKETPGVDEDAVAPMVRKAVELYIKYYKMLIIQRTEEMAAEADKLSKEGDIIISVGQQHVDLLLKLMKEFEMESKKFGVERSRVEPRRYARSSPPPLGASRFLSTRNPRAGDPAMGIKDDVGGIDFDTAKMNLELQNAGQEIRFNPDPAMLKQLQNVPGFSPVIIDIQPMSDLRLFLGLNDVRP